VPTQQEPKETMNSPAIGRNDPCPCGSGKKYKNCCLEKDKTAPSAHGAAEVFEGLREAMQDRQFSSLAEFQAFADRYAQQRNQHSIDEFHGLSPEQIHRLLYFPFASPELVHVPDVLDETPTAPVLTLFTLLTEAIGEQGLKSTAKGNLPQKFCREAAVIFRREESSRKNILFGSVNREDDFFDLHVTRLVAELAGLIRKYKGHFILSRDCRSLLNNEGVLAIYPRLLKTYIEQFNWGYWDGFPELRFIQSAFLFTLYLLTRYGDTWRPHTFYAESFLNAFPMVMHEVPPDTIVAPDKEVRDCYTWRTLVHFAGFFGLAAVEPVSERIFCREYRVKSLPLLRDAVRSHI
jgi:hypothetical protein